MDQPNESGRSLPRVRPAVTIRNEALRPRQQRIAFLTIVGPALGTAAAVGHALVRGFTALDLAFLVCGAVLGMLSLELGYHRLLAHRSFKTPEWLRTLLAIGASMQGQGRVIHWVANHRRHHVHSETSDDPHSPHVRKCLGGSRPERLGTLRGLAHAHWGHMLTDDVPNGTLFARDLNQDQGLRRVNEHYTLISWVGLLLPALIGFAITRTPVGALSGFLWGGLVRMFVVQNVTWAVASFCHRFGPAPYDAADESRNLLWVALPSFGSGYQNNHHAFPNSAFLGLRWWELDVSAWALRALALVGLAWDLKRPTPGELEAKRRARPSAAEATSVGSKP
jgi:stearoyl-CoA desaturase (delta-9 desaturase)